MADLERLASVAEAVETLAGVVPAPALARERSESAYLRRIEEGIAAYRPETPQLGDLMDVGNLSGAASGAILKFNGTSWVLGTDNSSTDASSVTQLDDLADVSTAIPASGEVLTYNGTIGQWEPAALPTPVDNQTTLLAELVDVSAATPTSGQVLTYNGTNTEWEPAEPAGGGSGGTFALKWEGIAANASYSANGVAQSVTLPAGTVVTGNMIRILASGRGGTGNAAGTSSGQSVWLALPDAPQSHLLQNLQISGRDWWAEIWIKVLDAGTPTMRLDFMAQAHEGSEEHAGDSDLASTSWNDGTADWSATGTIGIYIGNYVSGGGWVSFLHVQVFEGAGVYDGT